MLALPVFGSTRAWPRRQRVVGKCAVHGAPAAALSSLPNTRSLPRSRISLSFLLSFCLSLSLTHTCSSLFPSMLFVPFSCADAPPYPHFEPPKQTHTKLSTPRPPPHPHPLPVQHPSLSSLSTQDCALWQVVNPPTVPARRHLTVNLPSAGEEERRGERWRYLRPQQPISPPLRAAVFISSSWAFLPPACSTTTSTSQ